MSFLKYVEPDNQPPFQSKPIPDVPLVPEVPAMSVVRTLNVSVSPELFITSQVPVVDPVNIGNAEIFWFDIIINTLMLVLDTVIVFGCHNIFIFIQQ